MKRFRLIRYMRYGFLSSILIIVLFQLWCAWQVYTYAQRQYTPLPHTDAAVVLGAAAWGEKPSPVFRERINHAITLYKRGTVDKLIFTGGSPKAGYTTEAEVAKRFAIKQGVSSNDIIFENRSKDTYQNLVNACDVMRKHQLKSVIIITDPYHMARSMAIARDLHIYAIASSTPTSRFNNATWKTKIRFFLEESYALFIYHILHTGQKNLEVRKICY